MDSIVNPNKYLPKRYHCCITCYTAHPPGLASFAKYLLFPLSHFQGSILNLIYHRLITYSSFNPHQMPLLELPFTQCLKTYPFIENRRIKAMYLHFICTTCNFLAGAFSTGLAIGKKNYLNNSQCLSLDSP